MRKAVDFEKFTRVLICLTPVVIGLALMVLLSGCAPDPRSVADADNSRILAAQEAANQVQERELAAKDAEARQAVEAGTRAARVQALATVTRWAGVAGAVSVSGVLLAAAVGLGWFAVGAGRAGARLAEIRASLIPLSEMTRQYPVLLSYLGRGKFSLSNPNNGQVLMLDTRNEPDALMVKAAAAVQAGGVLAREARRSKEPEGVAMMGGGVADLVGLLAGRGEHETD
jgi:hypothetical protein